MNLETINRLYLELSQFTTAKSRKEIVLEDKLELCRIFLAECRGETILSPRLRGLANALFTGVFEGKYDYPVIHGVNCSKATHDMSGGYLHADDDDRPYDVDGYTYCGRCHYAI